MLSVRPKSGKTLSLIHIFRKLNANEGRIGLLAGRGMGEKLMQAALHWAQQQQLLTLRVATQMGNTAALKRYIASGANIDATAYWLYR